MLKRAEYVDIHGRRYIVYTLEEEIVYCLEEVTYYQQTTIPDKRVEGREHERHQNNSLSEGSKGTGTSS